MLYVLVKIILSTQTGIEKGHFFFRGPSLKGKFMESKLVKQFVFFLVILFAWTMVILLAGPK
jgi:hypothetical protein